MLSFIEELYYENVNPQARDTKENKEIQKQMEILMHNEEFLTKTLTGKNQRMFLDYVDAWGLVNGESTLDSFIVGFRLGANFTFDTFVSTETPFGEV